VVAHTLMIVVTPQYVEAAASQSVYNVTVCRTRGRIYDCKMRSLAGGRLQYRAVISPSRETTVQLTGALSPAKLTEIKDRLTGTYPFVCSVDDASADGKGAIVYPAQKRYASNCIAVHTVGYLGSAGQGVYGIERAYDNFLAAASGELSVRFSIDATGAGLAGVEPEVNDSMDNSLAGVVLTLDADVQKIAEEAAECNIKKGAIVVSDVSTGQIKAIASVPDFDQNDIASALTAEDSPLLNRAVSSYDMGSVFKIVVTAAALESGVDPQTMCNCAGSIKIGSNIFHCANRNGHGLIDMEEAFARSCNIYYIELARTLGADTILEYAEKYGFGQRIKLADDYFTTAGCLPQRETLDRPAALANLSFGQGELMASPVHVNAMTASIASGGEYITPTVFAGTVNSSLEPLKEPAQRVSKQIISPQNAQLIRSFMHAAVDYGTAKVGGSPSVICAAKTGTAETGMFSDGHRVMQAWYTGFFPAEDTQYAVTVLVEDGQSGGSSAGPVFCYIAERLGNNIAMAEWSDSLDEMTEAVIE